MIQTKNELIQESFNHILLLKYFEFSYRFQSSNNVAYLLVILLKCFLDTIF